MNERITPSSPARRALCAAILAIAAFGLAGCGSGAEEAPSDGATASGPGAGGYSHAGDLRNKLVDEGFPCDEGEREEFEGRTLSQCESGILLAVFDDPEAVPAVAENYLDNGEHVLRDEEWIVVDFQEDSRLPRYQEALGGQIVDE